LMLYAVEDRESKKLNAGLMWAGLVLYYGGVTIATVLLGFAGYFGGYAFSIQHLPDPSIEAILLPYVEPVTLSVLVACAGALIVFLNMLGVRRGPSVA
jgi:hypothetical protein